MILALPICCATNGMFSSRRIGKAAFRDVAVRFVAADTHPDHDTVATFRHEHQAAFAAAFASVLEMARELRAQPEADIAAPMARAEAVDEVDEARMERVPGEVARREALKAKRAAARARGRVAKTDAGNHADRGGQGKYKRRKCTVEPVFGLLGNVLGFNRFHLGGIENVKAEGLLVAPAYNCKRLCNLNAATGTPLSGLHRKDKWLAFGACLADGLTIRASAERCGLAVNTAFRWRHRFPAAKDLKARKLTGIVEADETCVPESRKGARNLERKARRRGGRASKRGLSDEQVPVLVVADRSGATVSAVLPAVNADPLREVIAPVVDEDIVLVTDGHRACPRCAAAIGAHHEALNLSRSERVRGAFHIQIAADPAVNNRHGRLKDFLRRHRGVATRYLDNDLRWFQRLELENASPRACLATAIARPCIQFAN